jgi:predicted transcriptional regulator
MIRTTIMADEATVGRLRALARDRGVPFAEVAREALAEKAEEYRPRPRSLGSGASDRSHGPVRESDGRQPARSWR